MATAAPRGNTGLITRNAMYGAVPRAILLCVLAAAVAGCSRAPLPADKNMDGGAGRTNFYPWNVRNLYNHKSVRLDSTRLPIGSGAPLCIGAQSYLMPMNNGRVACVRADTLSWIADAGRHAGGPPVMGLAADSNGNVYGSFGRTVFSLTADGARRWTSVFPERDSNATLSAPLALHGRVFACSDNGTVRCIDESGAVRWTVETTGTLLPQVAAMEEGDVVVAETHGVFGASDTMRVIASDGSTRARWGVAGVRVLEGPIVDHSAITLAGTSDSTDGRSGVVCRYSLTGTRVWSASVPVLPAGLAVDDEGNAYVNGSMIDVATMQSRMIQCDAAGAVRWYDTLDGLLPLSPAVTPKYVYAVVAFPGGRALYQFSRDGKIEETETIHGEPSTPLVDNIGRIVLADQRRAALYFFESDIVGKIRQ